MAMLACQLNGGALPSSPCVARSASRKDRSSPHLVGQRRGVEFGAGFAPGWEVLVEETDEPLVVRWLDQVQHLVDDDVLQQVAGPFPSSVFSRMFPARWLQPPHLIFMRWRNTRST